VPNPTREREKDEETQDFSTTSGQRSFLLPDDMRPRIAPIELTNSTLRILDQTLLPGETRFIETSDYRDVCEAIRRLAVRGAPLIGIAAAYGLTLALRAGIDGRSAAAEIASTRPTAVNLRWALDRVLTTSGSDAARAESEARRIHDEQIANDARCGELGAALLAERAPLTLLTHCNTGSLATGGIGSALGAIKTAHRRGAQVEVLVDETRPLLQGARLTSWELAQEGIPHRIIVDGAAAGIIARGAVEAVIVGADRIAANGDTANKVGTYGLALAATVHEVPFYVVAPASTIDPATPTGASITIEDRDADEVLAFASTRTAPDGAHALNPAFDVTPAHVITTIVTERGVLRPPYSEAIASVSKEPAVSR
jgi:methylthioribose-1-phosphate isomerase